MADTVSRTGAAGILTTEKDAVRLRACDLTGLSIAAVPLVVAVEPAAPFSEWLLTRIRARR